MIRYNVNRLRYLARMARDGYIVGFTGAIAWVFVILLYSLCRHEELRANRYKCKCHLPSIKYLPYHDR